MVTKKLLKAAILVILFSLGVLGANSVIQLVSSRGGHEEDHLDHRVNDSRGGRIRPFREPGATELATTGDHALFRAEKLLSSVSTWAHPGRTLVAAGGEEIPPGALLDQYITAFQRNGALNPCGRVLGDEERLRLKALLSELAVGFEGLYEDYCGTAMRRANDHLDAGLYDEISPFAYGESGELMRYQPVEEHRAQFVVPTAFWREKVWKVVRLEPGDYEDFLEVSHDYYSALDGAVTMVRGFFCER